MQADKIKKIKGAALFGLRPNSPEVFRALGFCVCLGAATAAMAEPYKMSTLRDALPNSEALLPAPQVDFNKVFQRVVDCGPTPSIFDAAVVRVQTGLNLTDKTDDTIITSEYGGHYVGIVASMPLFTGAEVVRQRSEEELRRQQIAQDVKNFKEAISDLRLAQRMIGLYVSLEKRAQARVEKGVTDTAEQVMYLEKTAKAWRDETEARARIEQYVMQLVGRCATDEGAREMDRLLVGYASDLDPRDSKN